MLRFLGAGDEGRQLRSPADHANRLSQDALEDWCHERSSPDTENPGQEADEKRWRADHTPAGWR